MQSQHPLFQEGLSQAEVDCLLRKEREGTLSTEHSTKTFAFLKPEALQSRVAGEVISRLEKKGFNIRQLQLHSITRKEAETLYEVHKAKPFFRELVDHVTSGPVV